MKNITKNEKCSHYISTKTTLCTIIAVAFMSFLPVNELAAQTKENNTKNSITADAFLEHLEVKITDPNEKALIDTVWSFFKAERSKQFTKEFFDERMKNLPKEEKRLYLTGIFCDIYMNFTKGKYWFSATGQKLADIVFDQMSDELFDATGKGYDEYVAELTVLWNQMIAEADKRIAEFRQRGAEADKRIEEGLRTLYMTHQNNVISDKVLQLMIKAKNDLRRYQKDNIYTPSEDIEIILQWIEQLERQYHQKK
jgi:hypothetical protein